jgi:CHAD domain-containing protein
MPILSKASHDEFSSPVERLLASVANLLQQPKSKGAHFYRTSLRRFQAWSDVFHPRVDSEQKQALKFLEKLRKITGKLRDSEVHLDLLEQLHTGNPGDKKKLVKVLKAHRDSYEKRLRATLRDPMLASIWRTLRPLDKARAEAKTPAGATENTAFRPIEGMSTLALDEYRAFVGHHGKISAQNLHEYRLECKRLRYTAELAGETPEVTALVETWKGVQDAIGEWHDYLTLSQVAADTLGSSPILATLQELTEKKYADSCNAVADAERKLIEQPVAKKKPRRAVPGRRSRVA